MSVTDTWEVGGFVPPVWLEQNALAGAPQKVTLLDGERVCGYIAKNNERIEDLPFLFRVPKEPDFDEYANTQDIQVTDGTVRVAVLPWKGGHAADSLGLESAVAHYDDPRNAGAVVRYGQDRFGIWAAGYVHPDADSQMRDRIVLHPTSGDWRLRDARWRFAGACFVNVPALPVFAAVASKRDEIMAIANFGVVEIPNVAAAVKNVAAVLWDA